MNRTPKLAHCLCLALCFGFSANAFADLADFTNPVETQNETKYPIITQSQPNTEVTFNSHIVKTYAFNPPRGADTNLLAKHALANPDKVDTGWTNHPTSATFLSRGGVGGKGDGSGSVSETLPEPGTATLLLGGIALWTLRRQRS